MQKSIVALFPPFDSLLLRECSLAVNIPIRLLHIFSPGPFAPSDPYEILTAPSTPIPVQGSTKNVIPPRQIFRKGKVPCPAKKIFSKWCLSCFANPK